MEERIARLRALPSERRRWRDVDLLFPFADFWSLYLAFGLVVLGPARRGPGRLPREAHVVTFRESLAGAPSGSRSRSVNYGLLLYAREAPRSTPRPSAGSASSSSPDTSSRRRSPSTTSSSSSWSSPPSASPRTSTAYCSSGSSVLAVPGHLYRGGGGAHAVPGSSSPSSGFPGPHRRKDAADARAAAWGSGAQSAIRLFRSYDADQADSTARRFFVRRCTTPLARHAAA